MISIIAAIARNWAIGKNNDLLWHIPADLKRFKKITTGHTVVMGKKTYESLPKRPLKDRRNVVLTDDPMDHFEGCKMVYSIEEILSILPSDAEHFIIGGASVYRQFLPLADKLYLTLVHKDFDCDVYFPEIDFTDWETVCREDYPFDEELGFSYSYVTYSRRLAANS
jgi:dihydrofolate reductase